MEENKYKAALERAKEKYFNKEYKPNEAALVKETLAELFPELRESEDERIRKDIIFFISENTLQFGDDINKYKSWIAWLEKQSKPEDMGEVSDGYHTFNELYYYRMLYNAAFFNRLPKDWVHKSKRHHDGEECFGGGWFIVMANLPTGQISNHYELKDWDLFQIPEKDIADEWDGHTPQQAAERLHKFLLEKQVEQNPVDKVEPKFHEGDLVVDDCGYVWKIEGILNQFYLLEGVEGGESRHTIEWVNKTFHLWSATKGLTHKEVTKKSEQEWTEEDDELLGDVITACHEYYGDFEPWPKINSWLKSLKQRMTWKPTGEQINALEWQVNNTAKNSWQYHHSKELLEQLQMLS